MFFIFFSVLLLVNNPPSKNKSLEINDSEPSSSKKDKQPEKEKKKQENTQTSNNLLPPRIISSVVSPLPPEFAQTSGKVDLKLKIDTKGNVIRVEYLNNPGPGLGPVAAVKAVNLKFKPALYKGKPIISEVRYTFVFASSAQSSPNDNKEKEGFEEKSAIADSGVEVINSSEKKEDVIDVIGKRPLSSASDEVIRNRDFQLFPRKTSSDLLLLVPHLHISQHSGSGKGHQIFLRGFDAEHGQDINISFNGVGVNEPSHIHGMGYTDLHFIIPQAVKRIKVMKGPYGVRFGNFATAGSMEFFLKDRLESSFVAFEQGNFNQSTWTAAFAPKFKSFDTWAILQKFSTDGFTANSSWQGIRSLYRISKGFKGGRLHLTINGYFSDWNSVDAIPARLVENKELGFYDGIDYSDGGDSSRFSISTGFRKKEKSRKYNFHLFYLKRKSTIFTNYTYFLKNPHEGDQTKQADNRHVLGGRLEMKRYFHPTPGKIIWLYGLNFRHDRIVSGLGNSEQRVVYERLIDSSGDIANNGIYSQVEFRPCNWFRTIAGLRHDYFFFDSAGWQNTYLPSGALNEKIEVEGTSSRNLFQPKLSLIFTPWNNFDVFINSGNGFHSINYREAVLNDARDIPPVWSAEAGWRWKQGKYFNLAGSFWGTWMESEIFFDPYLGRSVDTGSSRREGVEVEMRLNLQKWLRFFADASYTRAQLIETDEYIPNTPKYLLNSGFTFFHRFKNSGYFFDNSKLRGSLRARYIGKRQLATDKFSQAAFLVDFLISYRIRRYNICLSINNLLDQKWKDSQFYYRSRAKLTEPDSGIEGYHFTAGTPFSIKLSLRIDLP
ncbi:MAG: TonB-dependent receptor plug domain-containing protein [Myxococcota bacterium]